MENYIDGESSHKVMKLSFLYKSKTFQISMASDSTLYELGQKLQVLIGVVPHTLRLLLPHSRAVLPFSDNDGVILLEQSGISEGRSIRVMGALPEELEQVSQEAIQKYERGVIGFDDEDRRAKHRAVYGVNKVIQLPKGKYIFCEFKTLELPGIQLQPPASKALEIMHKLASDPGIVAIMNKHRWTVGIMTEMAPEGYVGISPECILGYNKNKGEEISLRIRTDDLKGFRKYESIKKTLLHELAHMVHSNHDANFHALNKQLNEEADALDWTKSTRHSLGGFNYTEEVEYEERSVISSKGQKLGGSNNYSRFGARSAAAQAALSRLSVCVSEMSKGTDEGKYGLAQTVRVLDEKMSMIPEDTWKETDVMIENIRVLDENMVDFSDTTHGKLEVSSQNTGIDGSMSENPGDFPRAIDGNVENIQVLGGAEVNAEVQDTSCIESQSEPDPDLAMAVMDVDQSSSSQVGVLKDSNYGVIAELNSEPDPDLAIAAIEADKSSGFLENRSVKINHSQVFHDRMKIQPSGLLDSSEGINQEKSKNVLMPLTAENSEKKMTDIMNASSSSLKVDYTLTDSAVISSIEDMNLKAVQENTEMLSRRIQDAITLLKQEATQSEAIATIQTLSRIVRNIKEHPNEAKFRCLKKETSTFRQKIAKFRGALEVLHAMGFSGAINSDGSESDCLVLKRDDPVLLWLAQSSLEACIA